MSDKRDNQNRVERDAFEREIATDLDEETPDRPRGIPLHTKILIGLAVGVIAGVTVNRLLGGDHPTVVWIVDNITQPVGQLFLRLLLMIVVPLVFSSLVVGVAGIGDVRKLGRVGLKSFGYCLVISAISVVIGLTLANTIKPGKRIDPDTATALQQRYATDATKTVEAATQAKSASKPLMSVVETIVPKNPFFAVAGKEDANMLHLMFFALVIGIAITLLPDNCNDAGAASVGGALPDHSQDHRDDHEGCAVRGCVSAFQQHRAVRSGSVAGARMVCVDGAARSVAAHVWRLLAFSLLPVAYLATRVFQTHKDCHPDGVLDLIVERHLADCTARVRAKSRRAAGD